MKWTYLIINIASVFFPFVFSFEKRLNFYSYWKGLLPAMVLTAIPFLIWDEWFTQMGVWGFNPDYLSGLYLGNLPLEEVLFFFAIPYATIFIYAVVNKYFPANRWFNGISASLTNVFISICILGIILFYDNWYTLINCSFALVLLLLQKFVIKGSYLGYFWRFYFIHLIPFFLVNSILTGSWIPDQVVWYNNMENVGVRIGTVPVEDFIYSMGLMLMNITLMEYFLSRKFVRR